MEIFFLLQGPNYLYHITNCKEGVSPKNEEGKTRNTIWRKLRIRETTFKFHGFSNLKRIQVYLISRDEKAQARKAKKDRE